MSDPRCPSGKGGREIITPKFARPHPLLPSSSEKARLQTRTSVASMNPTNDEEKRLFRLLSGKEDGIAGSAL